MLFVLHLVFMREGNTLVSLLQHEARRSRHEQQGDLSRLESCDLQKTSWNFDFLFLWIAPREPALLSEFLLSGLRVVMARKGRRSRVGSSSENMPGVLTLLPSDHPQRRKDSRPSPRLAARTGLRSKAEGDTHGVAPVALALDVPHVSTFLMLIGLVTKGDYSILLMFSSRQVSHVSAA